MTGIHGFIVADRGCWREGRGQRLLPLIINPEEPQFQSSSTAAAIPQAWLRSAGKRRYRKEFGGILRSEQVRVSIGAAWQGWVKDGGRHAWQRRQRDRGKQWLKTEDGARWTDAEADQGVRLGVVPASE